MLEVQQCMRQKLGVLAFYEQYSDLAGTGFLGACSWPPCPLTTSKRLHASVYLVPLLSDYHYHKSYNLECPA